MIDKDKFVYEFADLASHAEIDEICAIDFPEYMRQRNEESPRSFAEVDPWRLYFAFAPQVLDLDWSHRRGLIMHEIGHVLCREMPDGGTERDADVAAEECFGERIIYDKSWPGKGLQCVRCEARENPANYITLYHGSNDPDLKGVTGEGLFGGVFASSSAIEAGTFGRYLYEADIPKEDILDLVSRVDWDTIEKVIRDNTDADSDDDIDSIFRAIDESDDLDEGLWGLLYSEDNSDLGYIGWELQRLRGLVASESGYSAVEMSDEFGTSYLLLPGVEFTA